MHVITKRLPKSKIEITVTLPWEEWSQHEKTAVHHMSEHVNLPGFRKGKVPQNVLEGRLGRKAILAETAEDAANHAFPKALVDAKAEAIGKPEVSFEPVKEGEPLTFKIVTAVLPEVMLKDWKKAIQKINRAEADKKIIIDEAEVDKELTRLAEMRAKFITVNRAVQKGDSVEVNFTVTQSGVPIEGGMGKKHPLVIGSGAFIPGFEEALIGMQAGEKKSFDLSFPAEYHARALAGKPANFAVELLLVQERQIPALDDALAKSLGHFETLAEVKENMRKGIQEEKEREKKEAHRSAILNELFTAVDLEYPEILVQEESTRMLAQFQAQVERMGFTWERYLEGMKKTVEELQVEWIPQAKKRIAAELILQKLAAEQDIVATQEEIQEEMNRVFQHYKNIKDIEKKLDLGKLHTSVSGQLVNEKVLTWLEKL